ncbi:MAG: hypothetical protein J6113_06755 [Lachnospiraceae bacterium]|nr:hypothetical protein [Lachnospiraceae bacterium]
MRRRLKASFTVEAAFVMPVVICVVILLLEYSMILHDTVVFRSIAEEEAAVLLEGLTGKGGKLDFADLSRERVFFNGSHEALVGVKERISARAEASLLFSKAEAISVTKTVTGIKVEGKLKARRSSPLFGAVEKPVTISGSTFSREGRTRLAAVLIDTAKQVLGIFGGGSEQQQQ